MTATEPPVIELDAVDRVYPGSSPVEALKGVTLTVAAGEFLAVVGPSGSGKSTLLNVLGLLDRPTAGAYRFSGIDIAGLSDPRRAALRGQRIGFVFQAFHLMPHRTTLENVMAAQLYNLAPRAGRRERATAALERVGLGHRLDFMPGQLSGGERQRAAIARAIVSAPSLLLCDEPTGNLDTRTTESILDLFAQLHADGLTLIVITHDDSVSAHAPRTVRIVDGRLHDSDAALQPASGGPR